MCFLPVNWDDLSPADLTEDCSTVEVAYGTPIVFPTPTRIMLSPGFDLDLISFWPLLTAAATPVLTKSVMEDMASFEDIFTTTAKRGIWFFEALASIWYRSVPGPPIAAPIPSATSPLGSPSNFNAASTVTTRLIGPDSWINFSTARPGLPTFPPGPFARTTQTLRPSKSTS